jgi:CRP-like cAMP-binding protein
MTRPIGNTGTDEPLIPAFSPAIDSGIEYLAELPTPERIPARTLLLKQNVRPKYVHLIRSGVVRLDYANANGQEIMLGLRSEGCWLGAALSLIDVPSVFSATTVTACSISRIPVDDFSEMLAKRPRMLRHFISSQCRELVVEYSHSIMQASPAEQRLHHLRDELSNSLWKTIDPSAVMKQCEVAKLLAITPEHFSRLLHRAPRS